MVQRLRDPIFPLCVRVRVPPIIDRNAHEWWTREKGKDKTKFPLVLFVLPLQFPPANTAELISSLTTFHGALRNFISAPPRDRRLARPPHDFPPIPFSELALSPGMAL